MVQLKSIQVHWSKIKKIKKIKKEYYLCYSCYHLQTCNIYSKPPKFWNILVIFSELLIDALNFRSTFKDLCFIVYYRKKKTYCNAIPWKISLVFTLIRIMVCMYGHTKECSIWVVFSFNSTQFRNDFAVHEQVDF